MSQKISDSRKARCSGSCQGYLEEKGHDQTDIQKSYSFPGNLDGRCCMDQHARKAGGETSSLKNREASTFVR